MPGERVVCTGSFTLPVPAEVAMPLFTPEGEREWVGREWDPRYPAGEASDQPGTVFTTHHSGDATWVVVQLDRTSATYARVVPGVQAGTVTVRCHPNGPERCRVEVEYDLTALSPSANEPLREFADTYDDMLRQWQAAVTAVLEASPATIRLVAEPELTRFVHETLPQRVVFATSDAAGALSDEVERLGAKRLMVIASEAELELASEVAQRLPVVVWHHDVVMHVPIEVAERARSVALEHAVDAVVSIGGGSTTGLAKAVALTTGLPVIAVPTTYAGSEATPVWGLTESGRKTTGIDQRVLPRSVVYDASLLVSLPVDLSVASGLNALAHCVDSMWAPRANPVDAALALEGIRALSAGLPVVADDPTSVAGRETTLYGAHLAAVAFAGSGSGLHHKVCHVLGGMFDLPHAATHAVVLPHVLALNAPGAPEAERRMADAFGAASALDGLLDLKRRLDAPDALRDLGLREQDLEAAADEAARAVPEHTPVTVTAEDMLGLLHCAWAGADPRQRRSS